MTTPAFVPPAVLCPLQPAPPNWSRPSRRLPHQVPAHLAGMGHTVPVGTAVTLLPLRHSYEAALQARSLALPTGRPAVAGYGIGTPESASAT